MTRRIRSFALTAAFGGGGHPRAAGATVRLPIAQAKEAVLAHATSLVDALGR